MGQGRESLRGQAELRIRFTEPTRDGQTIDATGPKAGPKGPGSIYFFQEKPSLAPLILIPNRSLRGTAARVAPLTPRCLACRM